MAYSLEKDVYPFVGDDPEVDIVLFITDGKKEPKKINVRRSIEGDENFSGNAMGYGGSGDEDMRDFLYACSRTPLEPIQFSFDTEVSDAGTAIESSFKGSNGFQFCYQVVYNDGFVSAISPFSKVAYPDIVFSMGVNSLADLTIENVCNLIIPEQSEEARRVRILFREGNEGALKIIEEVSLKVNQSQPNWDLASRTFSFRNNEVYGVVSRSVLEKNYDHLPQKANTQTVSDNRLMYGGYTEGFDQVVTNSRATVIFKDRITRFIGSEIEVSMNTTLGDEARGADVDNLNPNTMKKQMHGGFRIDMTGMPSIAEPGIYDIRINVKPKQNWHIFSSQSFYGKAFTYFNGEDGTKLPSGIINGDNYSTNGYGGGANSPKSDSLSNDELVGESVLPVAGNPDHGILTWDAKVREEGNIGDLNFSYKCGTSPSNPLILKGSLVSFRVAFETKVGMSRNIFVDILDQIIMTGGFSHESIGQDDIDIFISPSSGSAPQFNQYVDLGLDSGDSFDADDDLADLVSFMTGGSDLATGANPVGVTGLATKLGGYANYPLNFFIVNRANYTLQLSPIAVPDDGVPPNAGVNPLYGDGTYNTEQDNKLFYRFKLADFSLPQGNQFNGNPFQGEAPEGYYSSNGSLFGNIMTCLPMPQEGLGAQTIMFIDDDGKEVIGMPYQGGQEETGISVETDWFGGDIRLPSIYGGDDLVNSSEDDFETISNWSYHSVPLMPFCLGKVDNGRFQFRWPVAKTVSGTNVPNSNIAHPSDNGLGVKDSSDTYLDFKTYDSANNSSAAINQHGRVQGGDGPVAIGKWFVYDGPSLANDEWHDDFSFTAEFSLKRVSDHNGAFSSSLEGSNNKFSGNYTFRAGHPKWWLPFPFEDVTELVRVTGFGARYLARYTNYELTDAKDKDGTYTFSVMDGSAGPGGLAKSAFSEDVVKTYNPGDEFGGDATGVPKPVSNTIGSVTNKTMIGICDNMPFINVDREYTLTTDEDFDDDNLSAGAPVNVGNIVSIVTESTGVEGSFKTNDVHNFGIVYYDERGRASSVYRLDNVYVPGYSDEERGTSQTVNKGSVDIQMEINHPAPDWAKTFKIVYAGAANTRRFMQTFAGGAYTEVGANGTKDDKIYISLNYLQGKGISYTKAFGAKDQDTGEPILYRFSEGDKVRVISSFINDEDVQYHPNSFVFDVIGVEEISELQDVNPLLSDDEDYEEVLRRTGTFLVVRNNINATGFDAQKVSQGTSLWGDRALIEIVTPKKSLDEELLPYFETDFGGYINTSGHVPSTLTITSGDTFFRVVPVNTREFIGGEFVDLIQKADNKDEDDSSSRFKGFYMESSNVSDLFRSQAKEYGRIHYVNEQASRNYNESGIIWGDKSSAETLRPTITSFPSSSTFLDLPKKFGPIDYLYDIGSQLVAFQETKISEIQVNKSITTAANGGENLALSRSVLNDPRFYKSDLGSNKRPESILVVDNEFYFVDEDKKAVCRLSGQQIDVLSDRKMSSFFEDYLADIDSFGISSRSKYSLGYNPRTKELIISKISGNETLDQTAQFAYGTLNPNYGSYQEGDVFYGANEANPSNKIGAGVSRRDVYPYAPTTLSYSNKADSWKTFYSFRSPRYEDVDNTFISINENLDDFIWIHNAEDTNNSFYGETYVSVFDSFLNDNPRTSHVYKSVSVDGDSSWNLILSTDNESTQVTNFVEKEGTFYSDIPRTELQGGTSHVKSLGVASSAELFDGNKIKFVFDKPVGGYTFNTGNLTQLYSADGGEIRPFGECFFSAVNQAGLYYSQASIVSIEGNEMVAQFNAPGLSAVIGIISSELSDKPLFVRSSPRFYGDALRDKYLKIEAVKSPGEEELVSINIEATPSNLDSSM